MELKTFLSQSVFTNSYADASLFVYSEGKLLVYVLIYVDDILVTGNNDEAVSCVIIALGQRFSLKDQGGVDCFLGIEVTKTSQGLHLMQRRYILDLQVKTNMLEAKTVATPMQTSPKLSLKSGTPITNVTEYRMVVGSLQYLAFTSPDISFAVNKLSQFMHCPTDEHWQASKRVLRYLAGTSSHGILLRSNNVLNLHAFSDSDWTGDSDDYVSTNAYNVYLGNQPISWSAKKQNGVARSSTEAEYRAIANTSSEVRWICNVLSELHIKLPIALVIYCI